VIRHADAGYDIAKETSGKYGLDIEYRLGNKADSR
jgi:urocanate hydratase